MSRKKNYEVRDATENFPYGEAPALTEEPPAPVIIVAPAPIVEARPLVGLDVFLGSCGLKFDQLAGFSRYARSSGLAALTINDWRAAFEKFKSRPV